MLSDVKLGKYFTAQEFCNSKDKNAIKVPNIELFEKLDQLREVVGSITITSGYRTPKFNKKVGGSSNSNHVKGLAADIKFDFSDWSKESLKKLLSGLGFTNIGLYYSGKSLQWIHVDIAPRWNQANGWIHFRNSSIKIYHI